MAYAWKAQSYNYKHMSSLLYIFILEIINASCFNLDFIQFLTFKCMNRKEIKRDYHIERYLRDIKSLYEAWL